MNSKDFKPGDILRAKHRDIKRGYHPIVFVEGRSKYDFIGAMITHHSDEERNIKMEKSHFESGFHNSFLVKGQFIKPENWGPFAKIGQLSERGLEFVKKEITKHPQETFAKYFARNAK